MSEGYEVFPDHLQAASDRCHQAAAAYKASMPNAGFEPVDCGEAKLDEMLGITLRVVGQLHLILAQALDQHGRKLSLAADNYDEAHKHTVAQIRKALTALRNDAAPPPDDLDRTLGTNY